MEIETLPLPQPGSGRTHDCQDHMHGREMGAARTIHTLDDDIYIYVYMPSCLASSCFLLLASAALTPPTLFTRNGRDAHATTMRRGVFFFLRLLARGFLRNPTGTWH